MASRQPFSRRRPRGGESRDRRDAIGGAYEFAAATWGWSPRRVRAELTDELLLLYLDAASDRLTSAFEQSVEAVRAGTILAHDARAYRRWRSAANHSHGRPTGLTGQALEATIMSLAQQHPEYVAYGPG